MQLVVGRIGKAHGLRGELTVEMRTDDPDRRFAVGTRLVTDPADRGPLIVRSTRPHAGRLLVCFEGVSDRTAAERLRGTLLTVDSALLPPLEDPEEFYDHELVGLAAFTPDGVALGSVVDVLHPPGPDLLVLACGSGEQRDQGEQGEDAAKEPLEVLVPFVSAIVFEVDVAAGRLVVDPPPGLLDLDRPEPSTNADR